jgi:hypothetical protein
VKPELNDKSRWRVVVVYALAMAWVEAAVVYYLRTMVNRIEPYQPNPLPIMGGLGRAELVREAATLIMIMAVGTLAGKGWRQRLGYSAVAFGVWDIFYYVFLKVLCGWPHSLLDWDILFLLPLPWWGPVLAPILISILMILWGTIATREDPVAYARRAQMKAWVLNLTGVGLALYLFMADSLRVCAQGTEAVRNVLPERFNWPWFCLALLFMSAPALLVLWPARVAFAANQPLTSALLFEPSGESPNARESGSLQVSGNMTSIDGR